MAGILHSGIYSGMIIACAEPFAPTGWLACDGSEKPISQYQDLYNAIGSTYGSASSGNFRLPAFNNGRAPRGASVYYPAGTADGSNTHSHNFNTAINASMNTDGRHHHNGVGPFTTSNSSGAHSHNFNVGVSSNASSSNMSNAKAVGGTLGTSTSGHAHDASMPGSTTDGTVHSHASSAVSGFADPNNNNNSAEVGGHNHTGPNVTNAAVTINAETSPHHLVFYMIKT